MLDEAQVDSSTIGVDDSEPRPDLRTISHESLSSWTL